MGKIDSGHELSGLGLELERIKFVSRGMTVLSTRRLKQTLTILIKPGIEFSLMVFCSMTANNAK